MCTKNRRGGANEHMKVDAPLGTYSIIQRQWLIACFWVCQYSRRFTFFCYQSAVGQSKITVIVRGLDNEETQQTGNVFSTPKKVDGSMSVYNIDKNEMMKNIQPWLLVVGKIISQDRVGLHHCFCNSVVQWKASRELKKVNRWMHSAMSEKKCRRMDTVSAENPIN